MEDPHKSWQDSSEVLQGLIAQPHPDPGLALDSNPLLDLHLPDLALLEAQGQSTFLDPWSASDPHDFYSSHCPSRLASNQDAWNPLQVTGVPNPSSFSPLNAPPVADPDRGFSNPYYATPSETGSQHTGSFYSADSGYASTSCATQSVVTSSYDMDSMSSPQIPAQEHGLGESIAMFDSSHVGAGSMFDYSPSHSLDGSVKCDHPTCSWIGKCPSDKRKHEARHRKLFKCDEPNCSRKEGFGTINDLARHKKCVHNKEPERGPKMMYLCFGRNCPRPNKKWPRLDNFKQHLSRMHNEEDADALLRKSMDWYENTMAPRASHTLDDTISQDGTLVDAQQDLESPAEMELDSPDALQAADSVDFPSSWTATPNSFQHTADSDISLASTRRSHLTGSNNSATERGTANAGTYVADAADNLINAMTKMMNNRGRRPSNHSDEGIEIEPETPQLSQPQRQMLQKVLSAALQRLSDDASSAVPEPSGDKQGWFQCEICSKRTRLRCEMKKHQKRHERPYGCTFPHCAKSFGSKADWKRHESSQHLHVPSWLCVSHDPATGVSCGRLFNREDSYVQHLSQQHRLPKNRVRSTLTASRLDLDGQSQFWCGFCNSMVPLQSRGSAALDERFNHIDVEHFKKGERRRDWCSPLADTPSMATEKGQGIGTSQTWERSSRKRKLSG